MQFGHVEILLAILTLGEFGHMTQSVGASIILATARHKTLAWLAVAEMVISIVMVFPMAKTFGLMGACLAFALPQAAFSGFGTLVLGCRVTGVGIAMYTRRGLAPAAVTGMLPVAALALLTAWHRPRGWLILLLYSVGYTLSYGIACWVSLRPASGGKCLQR